MKKAILSLSVFVAMLSSAQSQQNIVFHENFELPGLADSVTASVTGVPVTSWGISTTLHAQGLRSDTCQVKTGKVCYLTTNSFSTLGDSVVILFFSQICKVDFSDKAQIQVSADSGSTWTLLTAANYMSTGAFGTNGNSFSSNSYGTLWDPDNDSTVPINSWWKNEQFDCSALLANVPNAMIRFKLSDGGFPGPYGNYGWCLDNIRVSPSNGRFSGRVYEDVNGNCIFDSGDIVRPFIPLELVCAGQASTFTYSFNQGYYNLIVPDTINYSVKVSNQVAANGFSVSCPASGQYTVTNLPSFGNDFGLTCLSGFDLQGALPARGFLPGQTGYLYPVALNHFCLQVSGQVKLVINDPLLTYTGANPAPDTIIGDTLIWSFTNISNTTFWTWWNNSVSTVSVMTSASAVFGDTVCATLIVLPTAGDMDPSNNIVNICWLLNNSWDPNEKEVFPRGTGIQGYVPADTKFTYTIHFQNTGNAVANNIVVLDSLNANLDMETFSPIASSHPMQAEIIPGNVLRFNFPNINLPDSGTNEPLSHGWVSYQVTAKPSLVAGTTITNRAGIYFDLNPPVTTNTTLNTIGSNIGIATISSPQDMNLQVYPNPANEQINIKTSFDWHNASLSIFDLLGQKMISLKNLNGNRVSIDSKDFPDGFYFIVLNNGNKQLTGKFIIDK